MLRQASFLQTIVRESMTGIAAFDVDTRKCVYINSLARETLEIPSSSEESSIQIIDLSIDELFPDRARASHSRALQDHFLRHDGQTHDVLMRKKNGLEFIANVGVKTVSENGRSIVLIMFQDITVQKKLQREVEAKQEEVRKAYLELLEQNRQLKELDMAKDKFIALTTHELRTPLSAIVATAEMLNLKLYESDEQKADFIHTIYDQAMHLMELVNDVLDFSKIRAGKMEYYVERVDITPIIRKLVLGFEQMANQGGVTVGLDDPKAECLAYVDTLRLKEVMNNVVNNAIKYNRMGGQVRISIAKRDKHLRVTVTDTGVGIPADKISHVFNEFETVGHMSRHHKGTGLGMPISKRLIQAMGGDISLESEEGVGTKFYIDIPTEKVLPDDVYRTRPDAWGDLVA